jgi:uncharacterized protein (TIGR01319 family)
VASGEAPTTVEAPFEDVRLGVRNAIREVEELTGQEILAENGIITPCTGTQGVDLYVTTSSAGGGLQMMVAGVIKSMTAESAERAALGAGAIVMDTIAIDDGRLLYEKIDSMRTLRPDMILIAGGTDGGTITHVASTVEMVASAEPKPRLGLGYKLPIVYAGNREARDYVRKLLGDKFSLKLVENIRPTLETERSEPARDAIHELFMEHVMSHAPGYDRLMRWTSVPIMPTPAAEGKMIRTVAESFGANVIGVGLGGATTNVYSVFDRKFVRTVSANLGMSYSICNVLKEAKFENIMRWLPFETEAPEVRNRLRNKMIRPTTIPQTVEDMIIEHAVAREALRLGFRHHKLLARPLRGARTQKDIGDMLARKGVEETYIDMLRVDWIVGTGGLLSHAPRRAQSAQILIDAFQPEGITQLAQDSVFMMPHLGVLSTVHPKAAMEIFEKDCLIRLGTCIAPKGDVTSHNGSSMSLKLDLPDGSVIIKEFEVASVQRIALQEHETAKVEIRPAKGFDVGAGPGQTVNGIVHGGVVGIIVDTRGRPLSLPSEDKERRAKLIEWSQALDSYSSGIVEVAGS